MDKKNNKKNMLGYFEFKTSSFLLNANFMESGIQMQRIRDFNLWNWLPVLVGNLFLYNSWSLVV